MPCGGNVEILSAFGEAVGDVGPLFDGLVVVVLGLRPHVGDLKAQAADAGQHSAVGRPVDGDQGVIAVGLEVGELAAQQFGLGLGSSTRWAWQVNCTAA